MELAFSNVILTSAGPTVTSVPSGSTSDCSAISPVQCKVRCSGLPSFTARSAAVSR